MRVRNPPFEKRNKPFSQTKNVQKGAFLLKQEWVAITVFFSILAVLIVIAYMSHGWVDSKIARAIARA